MCCGHGESCPSESLRVEHVLRIAALQKVCDLKAVLIVALRKACELKLRCEWWTWETACELNSVKNRRLGKSSPVEVIFRIVPLR